MELLQVSKKSKARLGTFETMHGVVETPVFCPIATRGTVRSVDVVDLKQLGPCMTLANTYHLSLRPGLDVIKAAGGLHRLMNWQGPILTDSGGFQIFSLGARKFGAVEGEAADPTKPTFTVSYEASGATFKDAASGKEERFTPEQVIQNERAMGVDIGMVLDVCTPYPATHKEAASGVELTLEWARRSQTEARTQNTEPREKRSQFFAIAQGSVYEDLRRHCAEELAKMDFDGFAIGGVSVGEPWPEKKQAIAWSIEYLPEDKPRYLMGMGMPEEIVEAVKMGVDIFDCALPTRNARHGDLFTRSSADWNFDKPFYQITHITNEQYKADFSAPDEQCDCHTCKHYSKAMLRHLFAVGEPLAQRLASIHNVYFYLSMMKEIKKQIKNGEF